MRKLGSCLGIAILSLGVSIGFSLGCCRPTHRQNLPPTVRTALEQADSIELFALHPYPHRPEGRPASDEPSLHGYRILGRTPLDDPHARRALVDRIYRGIAASDGTVAACFDPRHGIRAVRGATTVDLVICYECLQMMVYAPELPEGRGILTASGVEPAVTRIFERAGLTIHVR